MVICTEISLPAVVFEEERAILISVQDDFGRSTGTCPVQYLLDGLGFLEAEITRHSRKTEDGET